MMMRFYMLGFCVALAVYQLALKGNELTTGSVRAARDTSNATPWKDDIASMKNDIENLRREMEDMRQEIRTGTVPAAPVPAAVVAKAPANKRKGKIRREAASDGTSAAKAMEVPSSVGGTNPSMNDDTSSDNNNDDQQQYVRPKYQKYDWEGIPAQEAGHPLVSKGRVAFVENARHLLLEKKYLEEFLTVYENRPDKLNQCGMRINHSLYLYLTVKSLQPSTIIENGVNAGHSTYIMRMASPTAKIIAIDPLEKPVCGQKERWIDKTGNAQYYTGRQFVDFVRIDWATKIQKGEIDPQTTLVMLDDHQDPSTRYPVLLKHGFRHILVEDNYKPKFGASKGDKKGWLPKQVFNSNDSMAQLFYQITKRYVEFPPLVPPILAKDAKDILKIQRRYGGFLLASHDPATMVAPLLRPDIDEDDKTLYESICQRLKIDPLLKDNNSYGEVMNYNQFAYMEFVQMTNQPTNVVNQVQRMWHLRRNIN